MGHDDEQKPAPSSPSSPHSGPGTHSIPTGTAAAAVNGGTDATALLEATARRLLAEVCPRLLLEVAEANAEAVTALLHGAGYRLFDAADPARGLPPVARAVWDTLAVPKERG